MTTGIYIGGDLVIHFTRGGKEVGRGKVLDQLLASSGSSQSLPPCPNCTSAEEGQGVMLSCLNCFLAGGGLYRFEYAVSTAFFLAKARAGTCTLAASDPNYVAVHRAEYLLEHGFGCYNVYKNNCEHFAIYCKTGLLVEDQGSMGQSGQAESIKNGSLSVIRSASLRLLNTNVYGIAASAVLFYSAHRYADDIGTRRDAVRMSLDDLTKRLRI